MNSQELPPPAAPPDSKVLRSRWRAFTEDWRKIPLEKKLAMFVAPLGVAIVSGVVLLMLDQEPEVLPAAAQLEVVDLSVGGGGGEPDDLPYIDIRVRNTGDTVSVVTGATLAIGDNGVIEICDGGGAILEKSAEYDVVMPPPPVGPRRVVEADVSQQIAPHEADRFSIRLTIPETEFFWHPHLYEVDVRLSHDGSDVPIEAGTAIVAVPLVPSWRYFTSEYPGPMDESITDCYRENVRILNRFLELDGAKSPWLTRDLLFGGLGASPSPTPEVATPDAPSPSRDSAAASGSGPVADREVLAASIADFEEYLTGSGLSCVTDEFLLSCDSAGYSLYITRDESDPQAAGVVNASFTGPSASAPIVFEGLTLLATHDSIAATSVRLADPPVEGLAWNFGGVGIELWGGPEEDWDLYIDAASPAP